MKDCIKIQHVIKRNVQPNQAAYRVALSTSHSFVFPPATLRRLSFLSWLPVVMVALHPCSELSGWQTFFPFLPDEAGAGWAFQWNRLLTFAAQCWDTLARCPSSLFLLLLLLPPLLCVWPPHPKHTHPRNTTPSRGATTVLHPAKM